MEVLPQYLSLYDTTVIIFVDRYDRIGVLNNEFKPINSKRYSQIDDLGVTKGISPPFGFGFLAKDLFAGLGTLTFNDSIYCNSNNGALIDSEFISPFFKNIPLYCTILGFVLSFFLINSSFAKKDYIFQLKLTPLYIYVYSFLSKK